MKAQFFWLSPAWLLCSASAATTIYDPLGRISRLENSDGSGIEYKYDFNGNQTNRISYSAPELIVTVDPQDGGFVTGGGKAPRNTILLLSALPAEGFSFVAWLRPDGSVFSTNPTVSHMLTGQDSLIAKFALAVGPLISEQPQDGQFIWLFRVFRGELNSRQHIEFA